MNAQLTTEQQKLCSLIKDIRFAMLTTACPDGTLRSRPMATQEAEFQGDLWFFTDASAPKVDEVRSDQHVNIAYADPAHNRYVSVSGLASIVRDKEKIRQLWSPAVKTWFPNGPDDPNIALLRVHPTIAEYWDAPSNKMVHLFGYLKAAFTGERPHPGENEKLSLDPDAQPAQTPSIATRAGQSPSAADQPGETPSASTPASPHPDSPRQHGDPLASAAEI